MTLFYNKQEFFCHSNLSLPCSGYLDKDKGIMTSGEGPSKVQNQLDITIGSVCPKVNHYIW